jgi:hypothetical protein
VAYDNGNVVEPVFAHNFDGTAGSCQLESAYDATQATDCGCLYMDTAADYGITMINECDSSGTPLPINGFSFSPGNDNIDLVIDNIGICPTTPAPGDKCGD